MDEAAVFHGQDGVRVAGCKVDVVHHQHDGLSELIGQTPQQPHHFHGVLHVQVVERLVQQQVFRVLGQDHGDVGTLTLPAGELVYELVSHGCEVQLADGLVNVLKILNRWPPAAVRKAPECHEVTDREPHREVVFLPEDGHGLGEFLAGRRGDVQAGNGHSPGVHGLQPANQ